MLFLWLLVACDGPPAEADAAPDPADTDEPAADSDDETDSGSGPELSDWYPDADGDGWASTTGDPVSAATRPVGYTDAQGDCDDTAPDVHPAATEVCNSRDDDCDGRIDAEDSGLELFGGICVYVDADGDGSGTNEAVWQSGSLPAGFVWVSGDCDDSDPTVHPQAADSCHDGRDADCDGHDCGGPLPAPWGAAATVTGPIGYGFLVQNVGDLDADGIREVWVTQSGRWSDWQFSGQVISTPLAGHLTSEAAARATVATPGEVWPRPAGDADGDGFDDVLLVWSGEVRLVSGPELLEGRTDGEASVGYGDRTIFDLGAVGDVGSAAGRDFAVALHQRIDLFDGATGSVSPDDAWARIVGPEDNPYGEAWAGAGDVGDLDGDGRDDLLVGVPTIAYGRVLHAEALSGGDLAHEDLDIVLEGPHPDGGRIGHGVTRAGDVDGDGLPDTFVSGMLFTGAPSTWDHPVAWTREDVQAAGDVDGDGAGDALVYQGVAFAPLIGAELGGEIARLQRYEVYSPDEPSSLSAPFMSVTPAGDGDGDGHDDLLVGVPMIEGITWGERVEEGPGIVWWIPGGAIR